MADFKHIIRNFSGGLLEDKREQSPNHFSITKHFDTFTYPTKLVPYAQTTNSAGPNTGGSVTALGITTFLYAANNSSLTTFRLFGLGANGSGNAKLYTFDIDAGTPNTTNWFAATNGESSTGTRANNVFFYYKGYIYTFSGTNNLNRFDATSVAAWTDGWQSLGFTTSPIQPVRHPSDDIAYFFSDNVVYSLNNTTWGGAALTLPANERITAACAYGNYLAIGTTSIGTLDLKSTVYLWDRDSSLTTVTDHIDFGAGKLAHLANLNNKLIGIVDYYLNNAYSLNKGTALIKTVSGSFATTINTITTDATGTALTQPHFIKNNRLYFPMSAQLNGDNRLGIWAVDENGKVALDTIEPNATSFDGIYSVADLWWIAHSGNGSVTHTDGNGTYSSSANPSIYESLILSTVAVTSRGTIIMNAATTKTLVGVTVTTEPLTSGQSVTLKYRADANLSGSWTTISTNSTVGTTHHDAVNIESSGALLPDYNEIQFRVESLGGAKVTGLEYGAEVKDKQLY